MTSDLHELPVVRVRAHRLRAHWLAAVTTLVAVAWTTLSSAAPPSQGPTRPRLNASSVSAQIASADASQLGPLFEQVRAADRASVAGVVPAISNRLKQGLPFDAAKSALTTLAEAGQPAAFEACAAYLKHRNADLRSAAVRCVASIRSPQASRVLRGMLHDPDPRVREFAATVLGDTRDAEAVPDLMLALEHGVQSAAASVGQLCTPNDSSRTGCGLLLAKLTTTPLDIVGSGLEQVLGRTEVPDPYKLKVIGAIRELSSAGARELLKRVREATDPKTGKEIIPTLEQSIRDLESAR